MWQIFFCAILIIYLSLHPLLLERMERDELIAIASSISNFVPLLILPWFIYLDINARIKAPAKDFRLYSGLRNRAFRTLAAFGTLFIIIRLGLRDMELEPLVISFTKYFSMFLMVTFILTFIYFNYFQYELASGVVKDFRKIDKDRGDV